MGYSLTADLIGDWDKVQHTLVTGTLTYAGIVLWLRFSGKRILSKWNAFDFVVTIAFGSILSSALLLEDTPFSQAMVGIGLLVCLQFLITWLAARSSVVQKLIKTQPSLLVFKGELLLGTLKQQRVAKGEVLAAIRLSGCSSVEDVDAVVLETDGSFSVIEDVNPATASALKDVQGFKALTVR